jgi:hypothetical protein
MTARHYESRAGDRDRQLKKSGGRSRAAMRGNATVPRRLQAAIEAERDNLARAESVLGCLVVAMEYEPPSAEGPYYPDVARVARELVKQSIRGLDSFTLQQHLLRNKIEEELRFGLDAHWMSLAVSSRYISSALSAPANISG